MKTKIRNNEGAKKLRNMMNGYGKFHVELMALAVETVFDDGRKDPFTIPIGMHRDHGTHIIEVTYSPKTPWAEKIYCTTFEEFETKLAEKYDWY